MNTLSARLITDAAELAALEPRWWKLWARDRAATPFQSPAWLLPWWGAFTPGELHVVAVETEGRLVALAPFHVERGAGFSRLLPLGIGISDYLDILLDPDCAGAALKTLASVLAKSGGWDAWEIPDLSAHAHALRLPLPPDCADSVEQSDPCPFLPLPADADSLRSVFPARKRRSLNLDANRAARRGALTYHSFRDQPAESLLSAVIHLHGLRWTSRGEAGVLSDARVQQFHRRAVPRLAAAGLARLYALRIGGETAAAFYGLHSRQTTYGYLTGMHPDYAYESPGTLIIAHAIEQGAREGARVFDFLRGGESYKYKWGAVDRWNKRRVIRRREAHAAA